MSEVVLVVQSFAFHLRTVVQAVRRDCLVILLAAAVIGAAGAVTGKLTNSVSSRAQLVMSPLPLQGPKTRPAEEKNRQQDTLENLLAAPLDVKSTSLLCVSDEVLETTLNALNAGAELSKPIKNLKRLQDALQYQIAVNKETPYDITYTPLLTLEAKASTPADAKLIVNTWAKTVVEAARRYQEAVQGPAATALDARTKELQEELVLAEMESEEFWTKYNPMYYETRLNELTATITMLKKDHTTVQAELAGERASLEAYVEQESNAQPTVALEWKPSKDLLAALGPKLGLNPPAKDAGSEGTESVLTMQEVNPFYWEVRGKIAATGAGVHAKEKRLEEIDRLVTETEKERTALQAEFAKATTGKIRAGRNLLRMEDAFRDVATKREFAQVASNMKNPPLQIISIGAEWPMPRFRRAILFGGVAGLLGLLATGCASVLYRAVLQPALRG